MTMKANGDLDKENCPSSVTMDNKDNANKDHEHSASSKDQPIDISTQHETTPTVTAETQHKPYSSTVYPSPCYGLTTSASVSDINDSKASTSGTNQTTQLEPPLVIPGLFNLANSHLHPHSNSFSFPSRTIRSTSGLPHNHLQLTNSVRQFLPPPFIQQDAMSSFEGTEDYESEMVESAEEDMPIQYAYGEQFRMVYSMGDEPDRKEFLDELFDFMQSQGTPINRVPIMAKNNLDLYKLFKLVVERGGILQVVNKKLWREITRGLRLPPTITSAAFTLRTQYCRYLYAFECKKYNFSKPAELQAAVENNRREGKKSSYMFDVGQGTLPVGVFPTQGVGNSTLFNQAMLSHMLAAKQMMGSAGFQLPVLPPPQLPATHPAPQHLPASSLHIPQITTIRQLHPLSYTPTCTGNYRDSPPIHSQMLKDAAFTTTHVAAQRRPSPFQAEIIEPKMIKLEGISLSQSQQTSDTPLSHDQSTRMTGQPTNVNGICQREKSGGGPPYVKMSIDVDGVIYNGVLHASHQEL